MWEHETCINPGQTDGHITAVCDCELLLQFGFVIITEDTAFIFWAEFNKYQKYRWQIVHKFCNGSVSFALTHIYMYMFISIYISVYHFPKIIEQDIKQTRNSFDLIKPYLKMIFWFGLLKVYYFSESAQRKVTTNKRNEKLLGMLKNLVFSP